MKVFLFVNHLILFFALSYRETKEEVEEVKNLSAILSASQSSENIVAVGYSGTILTSSDGISWTARTSGTSINLLGVTY